VPARLPPGLVLLLLGLLVWLAVALAPVEGADANDVMRQLGFLVRGVTRREEALLRLGLPSAWFDGERILTFRLATHKQKVLVMPREMAPEDPRFLNWEEDWPGFSLVLVFDNDGVLRDYRVVEAR